MIFQTEDVRKKAVIGGMFPLPRTGPAAQRKLRIFFCAEKGFLRKRKGHSGGIAAAECLRRAAGPCAGGKSLLCTSPDLTDNDPADFFRVFFGHFYLRK